MLSFARSYLNDLNTAQNSLRSPPTGLPNLTANAERPLSRDRLTVQVIAAANRVLRSHSWVQPTDSEAQLARLQVALDGAAEGAGKKTTRPLRQRESRCRCPAGGADAEVARISEVAVR
jgi:predicted signal transduction protein with EAL and GGDEF domain